jgi:hypothetical protein
MSVSNVPMGAPRFASAVATGPKRSAAASSNGITATPVANASITPWSLRDPFASAPKRNSASVQSRVAKMEAAEPTVSIDLLLRALFALGAKPRDVATAIHTRRSVAA